MLARANPYASHRVDALAFRFAPGEDSDALVARFAALDFRAALVGPEGSGKTTLALAIERRLAADGWRIRRMQLSHDQAPARGDLSAFTADLRGDELLSIDGADLLSWWRWRRIAAVARGARGLLITSHRAGLLPTLRRHRTSPELLCSLVDDLAGDSDIELCRDLHREHRGDLRACLRALYDRCSDQPIPAAAAGG